VCLIEMGFRIFLMRHLLAVILCHKDCEFRVGLLIELWRKCTCVNPVLNVYIKVVERRSNAVNFLKSIMLKNCLIMVITFLARNKKGYSVNYNFNLNN
jgi:hypothetical protein